MNEIYGWLTLKQAAELVGVTPRTVLNWIKDGKIKGYLTLKQAAELVGVTARTAQNRIKDGKVQGYQVVGWIRVKRSDVDALYQPKSPDVPGDSSGDRP